MGSVVFMIDLLQDYIIDYLAASVSFSLDIVVMVEFLCFKVDACNTGFMCPIADRPMLQGGYLMKSLCKQLLLILFQDIVLFYESLL
jgi:hypothetical protein